MESSLYYAIGGAPAVQTVVERFYARVWNDPELLQWFGTVDRVSLKAHQRAFLAAALGGPSDYRGRTMAESHAGWAITEAAFDRVVEHLGVTLSGLSIAEPTIEGILQVLATLRAEIIGPAAVDEAGATPL